MRIRNRLAEQAYDAVASTIAAIKTFTAAPVFNALPTGTAVSATNTASTLAARDSGGSLTASNFFQATQSIVSAAGTTVLDGSKSFILVTGTTTHTITLPTTFIFLGQRLKIINKSTGAVTVNASGGTLVKTLAAATSTEVSACKNTPTLNTDWDAT
jgi:hypothetical protein